VSALPGNASVHPKQLQANKTINKLYHTLERLPKCEMVTRLDLISATFLGKPYLLGALGEGSDARFDQEPLYRTDAFDCETYVTTVLALALGKDERGFQQCIRQVRYHNGQVEFTSRNHFTSLDWNQNNQRKGYIKDITESIKDKNNKAVVKIANALIDKPSWYQHFTDKNIRLNSHNKEEQTKRLVELKEEGRKLPKLNSRTPYIPLAALFDVKNSPNLYLFSQIPNAAIVEIVRPNWNLRKEIGTNMNVSHLGFVFWKKGVLYFREASSQFGGVVDIPLIDYLREALTSPTIKGINIQVVVPQSPFSNGCVVL